MSYTLITINVANGNTFSWNYPYTDGEILADINDIEVTVDGAAATLPNASYGEVGAQIIFNNVSSKPLQIYDYSLDSEVCLLAANTVATVYLIDNSDSNGTWRTYQTSGVGSGGITSLKVEPVVASGITVDNGIVSAGTSGDITIGSSSTLTGLNKITGVGLVTSTSVDVPTFTTRQIVAGNGITVENPRGIAGDITVSLPSNVSGLVSLAAGNLYIQDDTLASTSTAVGDPNDLIIASVDNITNVPVVPSHVYVNGVGFDVKQNVTNVNDLTIKGNLAVTGTFNGIAIDGEKSLTNINKLTAVSAVIGDVSIATSIISSPNNLNLSSQNVTVNGVNIDVEQVVTNINSLNATSSTIGGVTTKASSIGSPGTLTLGSTNVIVNGVNIDADQVVTNVSNLTATTSTIGGVTLKESSIGAPTSLTIGSENIYINEINIDANRNITNVRNLTTDELNVTDNINTKELTVADTINTKELIASDTITTKELTVTDKITTQNLEVQGPLFVSGNITTAANLTANIITANTLALPSTASFSAVNTAKVWGTFKDTNTNLNPDTDLTPKSPTATFNVESITGANGVYTVNFITAFIDANYAVCFTLQHNDGSMLPFTAFCTSPSPTNMTLITIDTLGNPLPVTAGISFIIFGI